MRKLALPLACALVAGTLARAQNGHSGGHRSLQDSAVTESSGVVASRLNPGIFWTHNDSGDGPVLYAFDLEGRSHGRWTVAGGRNIDWEDIAIGPGPAKGLSYIYIGDIGDNNRRRKDVVVYRLEEPDTGSCSTTCTTGRATALHLRYPDHAHNAETLLVHPKTGDLYIVTKANAKDPETTVYAADASQWKWKGATLKQVAVLDIPDPLYKAFAGGLTGGDISPDGRRVVFCDYLRVYEAEIPAGAAFDAIWKKNFTVRLVGGGPQVEGICFRTDGKGMVATSEGIPCPIFEIAP